MKGLFGGEWEPAGTCHLGGSPAGSSGTGFFLALGYEPRSTLFLKVL